MSTKPKKFLGRHEADRRALRLYAALREIEEMPLIGFRIDSDEKQSIYIWDETDRNVWAKWSVDGVLMRDIAKAKAAGGRYIDLVQARRQPPRPRVPQSEVDRASHAFMTGNEEEDPPE